MRLQRKGAIGPVKSIIALSGLAVFTVGSYLQFGPIALMGIGLFLILEAKFIK